MKPLQFKKALLALLIGAGLVTAAQGQLLRDICRVKGQEENTLQGMGLVVGLKGTGDSEVAPTARALATMMEHMAQPLERGDDNRINLKELAEAKDVAMVVVTATIPAAGARQGGQLNCTVSAISAKSIEGGVLLMTPLLGPRAGSQRVYAFAQGRIQIDNTDIPTVGHIQNGCRLEEDFFNFFVEDDMITLVLDRNHAGFQMAQDIAHLINTQSYFEGSDYGDRLARAIDQVNIEVKIPEQYRDDPVDFVSQILSQRNINPQNEARVVIHEETGAVVIDSNVEIGPVVVTHRNMVVEAGALLAAEFVPVDPSKRAEPAKLRDLVDALNALNVPQADVIDIIKGLDRSGKLYAKLIIE